MYTQAVKKKNHTAQHGKEPKQEKFDFEKMKSAALSDDSAVRKQSFIEYFERFSEFPSYLFDNEHGIDIRLSKTIQDILNDPEVTKELRVGTDLLMRRLAST